MEWKHTIEGLRRRSSTWVVIILAVLFALDLSHFAWLLRPQAATPMPAISTPRPQHHGQDLQQIVRAHLFGVAGGKAGDAPDSHVALTLHGVIVLDNAGDGYAILADPHGASRLYRRGAALSGDQSALLYQILSDRVILQRYGQLETLRMPRERKPGMVAAAQVSNSTDGGGSSAADVAAASVPHAPSIAESWFGGLNVRRNGMPGAGLAVYPQKHYQRQYGLQDGDTVTAVNGVNITDAAALDGALASASGQLSVTFVHDGVEKTVDVQPGN